MPTNPASVRLICRPVYLLAGTARSFTSTRSSVALGTLKPIASVVTTVTVDASVTGSWLRLAPDPTNPLAVSARFSTSALNDRLPSSMATSVCFARLNVPATTTKPNASRAMSPDTARIAPSSPSKSRAGPTFGTTSIPPTLPNALKSRTLLGWRGSLVELNVTLIEDASRVRSGTPTKLAEPPLVAKAV